MVDEPEPPAGPEDGAYHPTEPEPPTGPEDGAYHPTEPEPPTGPEDATGHRAASPKVVALVAVAVAVVVGLVFTLTRGGSEPVATTTTTSTAGPTSTTVVEKLPAGTFELATVKPEVARISVVATEPANWASTPSAIETVGSSTIPPASRDAAPERPAIPTITDPVQGRYAVDGGWEFKNPGPFDPPQPLTFLVVERRGNWAQVMLPVRPNGTVGFVRTSDVNLSTTRVRIEVHVADHKLVAYDGSDVIVESPTVTGVNFTPTPTGAFYLTDIEPQKNPNGFYGPFVLATSGYSEILNEFDGGVPVIAIHGTNRPELMGQDKSNGCIRVPNDVITTLAEKIPQGAPILIWP